MAEVAVAAATLAYDGYNAIAANQKAQKAKGIAGTILDQQAKMTADATAASSVAAGNAARLATTRAKASGAGNGTILTAPTGLAPATTQRKTLLGL